MLLPIWTYTLGIWAREAKGRVRYKLSLLFSFYLEYLSNVLTIMSMWRSKDNLQELGLPHMAPRNQTLVIRLSGKLISLPNVPSNHPGLFYLPSQNWKILADRNHVLLDFLLSTRTHSRHMKLLQWLDELRNASLAVGFPNIIVVRHQDRTVTLLTTLTIERAILIGVKGNWRWDFRVLRN